MGKRMVLPNLTYCCRQKVFTKKSFVVVEIKKLGQIAECRIIFIMHFLEYRNVILNKFFYDSAYAKAKYTNIIL